MARVALTCRWLFVFAAMISPACGQSDAFGPSNYRGGNDAAPSQDRAVRTVSPRMQVPDEGVAEQSLTRIRDIFASEYALATTPRRKSDLARRLAAEGATTEDPVDRWTLLSEALRLATDVGDAGVALPTIDRLSLGFSLDQHLWQLNTLSRLAGKSTPASARQVGEAALRVARDADAAGDDAIAAKAINLASTLARKSKSAELLADAARLQQRTRDLHRISKEVAPLLERVASAPADPIANLEAGLALCLKAERWDEGLPLLAKGSDAALARLAAAERANPTAPADLIRLADGWWDWADAQKPPWKLPAQTRAAATYGRVVNDLRGLDKARVEKRIANVAAAGGGTGQTMFLADLQEAEVKGVVNNFFSKNGTLGRPFEVGGRHYPKAVMALPDSKASSTVAYRLPAGVVRTRGRVGIFSPEHAKPNDQPATPLAFQVVADGEVVWSSPPLTKRDDTAAFDIAIRNAAKLELRTTCTGHNNNGWGAWLDPVIVK